MAALPQQYGPYVLLKSLGSGGTGDVHLARAADPSRRLPSPVVIKRLHGQLASQEAFVRRFKHEAQIAVSVKSPHVAKVYDVGRVGESFYIAMEYVAGWTLARIISDVGEANTEASLSSVIDIITGALSGLAALHSAQGQGGESLGIVHRDIAPKNILVGEDGVTRLIDLGLGKSSFQDWKTGTGVVMGSPGYMAPEQVTGQDIDQRVDVYAMGIVLWEFLTLKRYIKRGPVPIMLRAQVKPDFVPPSQLRKDCPPALDEVCRRALAIDRNDRFDSAQAFQQALLQVLPRQEEEEPLATIVGEMLWGELGQSKSEVTKLLSLAVQTPMVSEPKQLEVFAAQEEPAGAPTTLTPSPAGLEAVPQQGGPAAPSQTTTFLAPHPSEIPPGVPPAPSPAMGLPLQYVPADMPPAAQGSGATPTPMQYVHPVPLAPPSRGVPMSVVMMLMMITLAVGIGVTFLLLRGQNTPLEPVPTRAAAIQAPEDKQPPAPEIAPVAVAPSESESEESKAAAETEANRRNRKVRGKRGKNRVRKNTSGSTKPKEQTAKLPPKARLLSLLKQTQALRNKLPEGSPKRAEAGKLLHQMTLQTNAPELSAAEVERFARALRALRSP